MRIARILDLRDLLFAVQVLLLCHSTVGQDCNGVYIDFQCHTFGYEAQPWLGAEGLCSQRYAIYGYTGAHLTSIGSQDKQTNIEKFMDRFGMRSVWVGATNKPLLWQWITNKQDIQAQGCYNDSTMFSYRVQITGLTVDGCIDACNNAGYGYAGIQNGGSCVCAHTLDSRTMTVGCNSSCLLPTSISKWCGGPDILTSVYRIGGANGAWGYNQPDMLPAQKSCGVLDMNLETKMADENCTMQYDYLCQINTSSSSCTGPGYQMISQLCYYVSNNSPVNWTTARDKCRTDFNGELAMVDNNLLQAAVRQWLSTVFPTQNRKIWIGAYKGGWYWMAAYSFSYTNWAANEPSESTEDQCLFIDEALGYKWQALPCPQSKLFICQRGYALFTTPALNWIGPTPPTEISNSGGTVGTGSTGVTSTTVSTGGIGTTVSTVGTGGPRTTGGTGGTGGTVGIGSTVSTGGTGGTGSSGRTSGFSWSTTASFLSNSTANLTEPDVGANMDGVKAGWSDLAIGLFAFLAIVLFLCLLLALLLLALCIAKNRGNKVGYAHHFDARPIAHVPNSGEHFSSTTSLKNAAEPVGTS